MPSLWHSLNFYAQLVLVLIAAVGFIALCGWILACVADAFDAPASAKCCHSSGVEFP